MDAVHDFHLSIQDSWAAAFASLLPMWLVAFAVSFEGGLGLPAELAFAVLGLAIMITVWLVWAGWITLEYILLYLAPFPWVYMLDEISIGYKTPFIVMAVLVLTIGCLAAQRIHGRWTPALPLLVATVAAYTLLINAAGNFWGLIDSAEGYMACFPYCEYPEHPWWKVFFRF